MNSLTDNIKKNTFSGDGEVKGNFSQIYIHVATSVKAIQDYFQFSTHGTIYKRHGHIHLVFNCEHSI